MILGFSTQLNGKPTYFVEKIWTILHQRFVEITPTGKRYLLPPEYFECLDKGFKNMQPFKPKLHTIREDAKDRWKAGTKIDFFINCRQKDMFQFAPVLPVVSVQKIEIKWFDDGKIKQVSVFIDGKIYGTVCYNFGLNVTELYRRKKLDLLAQNDGFDTIEEFFAYFNKDFTGKLIHWTDIVY